MRTPNNKKSTQQLETLLQQQAEKIAQLEKAQELEAALENVRSVSLSIQHSSQILDVVNTINKQFQELGLDLDGTLISIRKENQGKELNSWVNTKISTARYASISYYRGLMHTNLLNFLQKEQGLYVEKHPTSRVVKWYAHIFKKPGWKERPEKDKQALLTSIKNYVRSSWGEEHTALTIIRFSGKDFSVTEHQILERLAKVFEQAYIRFLDIQKAEAKAKEAQIDAAIERIRAKALAMHHSQEVKDIANACLLYTSPSPRD